MDARLLDVEGSTRTPLSVSGGRHRDHESGAGRERSSVLNAAIRHAKIMKDWEALRKAVDLQIKEQRQFVAWWRKNVRSAGGDQKSLLRNGNNGLSEPDDRAATGIRSDQVTRWEDRLENIDAYRDALFGPSYR